VLEREKQGALAFDVQVDADTVFERFPSTEKNFRFSEKISSGAYLLA
jgi:hypothetical protein